VNPDLRALLNDLAVYLEQQQEAGGRFFFETPGDGPAPIAAEATTEPATGPPTAPADGAAPEAAPEPAPPSAPAAPPAPPKPARSARDQEFQRRCDAFVQDALALIARTRGQHTVRPADAAPEQSGLFGAPASPVARPAAPEPDVPADADPALRARLLEALGDEVRACTACPLHAGRRQAVPGAGDPAAGLMLVGEAPGQEEDRQGLPFVGRSGQLLTDILMAIGFTRDDVFIGNVLKCRPPGNRDPEPAEVAACEPYLRRQIRIIQPRLILCLGRIAGQTLLSTSAPLRSLRQAVHFFAGVPVMVTFHPAALLRNPAQKRDAWDDVRLVRALHDALGEPGHGA
jgi:DNA polymerase